MRLLVTLLFLLTPLQPVAALAFCLDVEHGTGMPCDSGMSEMSERENLTTIAPTGVGTGPCGPVGLCSAPVPGVASIVARALPEHPADTGPLSSLPHLGPGIRPAPPLDPPRA
jgi:hypothetical protein